MAALLAPKGGPALYVSGTVANQGRFYPRSDDATQPVETVVDQLVAIGDGCEEADEVATGTVRSRRRLVREVSPAAPREPRPAWRRARRAPRIAPRTGVRARASARAGGSRRRV